METQVDLYSTSQQISDWLEHLNLEETRPASVIGILQSKVRFYAELQITEIPPPSTEDRQSWVAMGLDEPDMEYRTTPEYQIANWTAWVYPPSQDLVHIQKQDGVPKERVIQSTRSRWKFWSNQFSFNIRFQSPKLRIRDKVIDLFPELPPPTGTISNPKQPVHIYE